MKLFDYYRSTASYRVRIALNIKGISYERFVVHLTNNGGEQHHPDYLSVNPQGLVPSLVSDKVTLHQSLAIIEYLEDIKKTPPLLPENPIDKSIVRGIAQLIACDIHPLNNLRVLKQLKEKFGAGDSEIRDWYHHWLKQGFDALEKKLLNLPRETSVCFGDSVTIADICLIPQVYNANRFEFPLNNYPIIEEINRYCLEIDAFKQAQPESLA